MSIRASIIWKSDLGEDELASTVAPHILRAVKMSALEMAAHIVATKVGDDVLEQRARLEYEKLRKTLDAVLPDSVTVPHRHGVALEVAGD